MMQVVCDRCGRTGDGSQHTTVVISAGAPNKPTEQVTKHYCQDPDGQTVGCDRIVMTAINNTVSDRASRLTATGPTDPTG